MPVEPLDSFVLAHFLLTGGVLFVLGLMCISSGLIESFVPAVSVYGRSIAVCEWGCQKEGGPCA